MRLLDVNVWLALAFEVHGKHRTALRFFDSAPVDSCAWCRLTQQGFLRLATNPSVFGEQALTLEQAWSCYDQLLMDERVLYLDEPPTVEASWRGYTSTRSRSPKVWNDAYLAAFALESGLEIVTFDRGFRGYDGTKVLLLSR